MLEKSTVSGIVALATATARLISATQLSKRLQKPRTSILSRQFPVPSWEVCGSWFKPKPESPLRTPALGFEAVATQHAGNNVGA